MTSKQRTPDEIKHLAQNNGPVTAAAALDLAAYKDEALIDALAAGASRRNILISAEEEEILGGLSGSRFFNVQIILNEVIPKLHAPPTEVMRLVRRLVEMGGDDMAATQPNAAFRKWCAADPTRADAVIAAARNGDEDAQHHIVFALEAKGDPDDAFRSVRAVGSERTGGILALSRLPLDVEQAQRAVALILDFAEGASPAEAAGLLHAALEIAAKQGDLDRTGLADALGHLANSYDPAAVHLLATALYRHQPNMIPAEYKACLLGICSVDPENAGTVKQIDSALGKLWTSCPEDAARAAAEIIARTEGRIASENLEGFFHAVESGDPRATARLATSWLLKADYHVCETLSALFSEINRTEPCIQITPADLPEMAEDQLYLCRKAIGFLFLSPMTAASWIVAVLDGGHPDAAEQAADLLFDPLLVNYGGALYAWLECLADKDALGQDAIRDALDRARTLQTDIAAASDVVELEPSTHHRAQLHFMEAEEAEGIQEQARARSIFADIVSTQYLLYGDRSSVRITDRDGRRRSQTTHLSMMSVSSELPKGLVFDPIGLEHMLEVLRHERRAEA
ncbi:hypothetical protein D2T29_22145 [Sinirhodobacter populi]|uniref:Uncharacterized protein n=1 Tax=Paenirhodobacter populi TaxID=2306993 RepID=A0A443JXY1_9RHOB|nr:hypothetical protein [Sinirhodobacter populi]RWR25346.1 hypothetical protein D2T29_22145 [Sinirhodobacter populi]